MIRIAALFVGLLFSAPVQKPVQAPPVPQVQDLTLVFGVWTPGDRPFQVTDFAQQTLLIPSDHMLLEQSLSGGTVVITGGDSSGNTAGSLRRMIVLFTGPLTHGVRLSQPDESIVLYVQDGDNFEHYPPDFHGTDHVVEFMPDWAHQDRVLYTKGLIGGSAFIGKRSSAQAASSSQTPTSAAPTPRINQIAPPQRIKYVPPTYPPQAAQAGVQGVVILEIEIAESGKVREVKVLRSLPFLDQAAIDCVRQWEYTPTLINGVPVPFVMTVAVNVAP